MRGRGGAAAAGRPPLLATLLQLLLSLMGAAAAGGPGTAAPPPRDPGNVHAVIVSTSRYWFNYRHSSNAMLIYNRLRRTGVPDSNIVLMLADDHACDARNPPCAPPPLPGCPAGCFAPPGAFRTHRPCPCRSTRGKLFVDADRKVPPPHPHRRRSAVLELHRRHPHLWFPS